MADGKTTVSVREAARRAGAVHVWRTQLEAGAKAGWAAGWAAGWTKVALEHQETNPESNHEKSIDEIRGRCEERFLVPLTDRLSSDSSFDHTMGKKHIDELENDTGDNDEIEFEMNPVWARLFTQGEERRKRQERIEGSAEVRTVTVDGTCTTGLGSGMSSSTKTIGITDLGGIRDSERQKRARDWYGCCADDVLELEAELDAQCQQTIAESGASFWPVV